MTFDEQLDHLAAEAKAALTAAADLPALEAWDRAFLGPKGELTRMLRSLGSVAAEERPAAGRRANALKVELQSLYSSRREVLSAQALSSHLAEDAVDVTLPGRPATIGVAHPITQMIAELSEIFALMGFQTVYGPEVETARYNFDLLNIPSNHPARDVWDTMIVDSDHEEIVLRTHTSPMQARVMEQTAPPVRVIVPGRAYRF